MSWNVTENPRRVAAGLVLGIGSTALVALLPTPPGLNPAAQYALATMALAASLWVTKALPLPVTALLIPVALTGFGVYDSMERALSGFADPLIFLFIAGHCWRRRSRRTTSTGDWR